MSKLKIKLKWCPHCKENSVVTRIYQKVKRVDICVNAGCGHVQDLPALQKERTYEEDSNRNICDIHPLHPDNK